MQQNLIWTALAGVWIILIVSQAKEQFYYDNGTIETAINYPITHDESVSPPYDLSSSSSITSTSSPTRNSIAVKSYRVNITLKTRNQIFSDTSEAINSSVEKIVKNIAINGGNKVNPSEDRLKVLSYPRLNKFKTIDTIIPKTTSNSMTTIKTNFIEASTDIPSTEVTASIKSSKQPYNILIQIHENVLQVPFNEITHSESKLKSNKDKNKAENNNGLNPTDKHVTESIEFRKSSETSEIHNSALLSFKNDESGDLIEHTEDLSPETYTALQNPSVSTNNTLKKFKEPENEYQKQKNKELGSKVLGNLFGKLIRDKPPTSSANEKSRSNYLEPGVKPFVTSKPIQLMPFNATIWKVDKNSSIKSVANNHRISSSANYFPSSDIDDVHNNDAAYRLPVTDIPFTASEINEKTEGSDTTEIFITVDESVTSQSEINSSWRIRAADSEKPMEGLRYKKSENLTNVVLDKTIVSKALGARNNKETLLPNNGGTIGVTDGKQLPEAKWNSGKPLSEVLSSDLLNSELESQTRAENSLPANKATSTEAFNSQSLGINATEKESPDGHPSHNNAFGTLKTGLLDSGYYEENEFQLSSVSKDSLLDTEGNGEDLLVFNETKRNWTEADRAVQGQNGNVDVKSRGKLATRVPVSSTDLRKSNETNLGAIKSTQTAPETGKIKSNGNQSLAAVNQWPVKHSVIVEGDLVLGGLMMVHEREDTITCGPVMPQGGVQALEAMLFTLDWLSKQQFIPGVKIGAHILDDCDKDTYGLEMAVDFIKGSISNIDGAEYHCNKSTVRKVISGVVGAASSVTSIQVANLLRLFRIPQVSFFSTSPELSNKQRFEYFTRTIPSDHYQVKAMVDIIRKMGWSYVSIVYEESNYGIKAYEELEELLAKHQICIAIKEKLVKDSGVAEEIAYDNIVQKLLTKPRARGCIIFGSDQEVAEMMRAVRRNNATGAFYWIGSDGWSARGLVSNKNEPEVEGTLSVQPQANPVVGFEEYFLNLTVENNRRNPWFVEFWEDHFQCRYPNSSRTPYNKKYKTACTAKERLTKENTAFEDQLQFVSDAVMAFAFAFRDMHKDLCQGESGLCEAMKPTKGTELLKYLRKVKFQGLSGDQFHFDKNGDGPARYNIIHFKQVSPGEYKWVRVGKYLEGELRLNMSEIKFRLDNSEPPESVCSLPCRIGQAKKYVEGESCCWHCFDCTQYQIRHATDHTRCVECPQGTVPDEKHSSCRDIPEEFLKFDSGWAIGAMTFSASGILVTLFVGGVFLKHNDTPIVRASGRELSYVLLTGILLCYLVTFTLILKPTDIVCGIQRFAAGFCFTVVYAALLTKTNRISRIFNKSKKSAKRPSFISPRSQLIICSLLVGVQILINIVWMAIDPARAKHHYPTREDNLLVCNSHIDASYMIAFTYPIILIIVCTVYAVLTRKIPEDFNESKHIGFTMYTTCVIWLAFVPLFFGTGNHVALRITSMSVTISLSASVTIACLFSPKLYIILIHPERNIRRGRGPFAAPKHSTIGRTNASSMISTVTLTAVTCDQNKAVKGHTVTTNDSSTQSEMHEIELKDCKNGRVLASGVTRSTQTSLNNNETVNDDKLNELGSAKSLNVKIGNGPAVKKDVAL